MVSRVTAGMLTGGLMVLAIGGAWGEDYPNKPVRILTSAPGGGNDFAARLIAQGLSSAWGQPVIVENRGGGTLAAEIVAKAAPDGYTLINTGNANWYRPLTEKTSYDPLRDYSPITLMGSAPNVLVVHPSLPVNSVKELIALAKAKPGQLNFATGAPGSAARLAGELLKSMAGIDIVQIPYQGGGPAINGLLGGQEVQMYFSTAGAAAPHLKTGRLRALAVTSAKPSALFPGLPTVAATLPGYEIVQVQGVLGPAKMPAVLVKRLNQDIVRILNRADVKEKFAGIGVEVVGSSPEQFTAMIKSDIAVVGKVIKDAGIKAAD